MTRRRELYQTNEMNADENSSFWLVPYGNMMTILMIFFLVMYAFSTQNKEKMRKITKSIEESITSKKDIQKDIEQMGLTASFRQFVWHKNLSQFIEVSASARRILISMQAPVLFAPGSVTLKPEGKEVLDRIAELIRSESGDVRVAGFTDNTPVGAGAIKDNWELSGIRAHNVADYFIQARGLLPIRFSMIGCGEYAPQAKNDTPENRALNRRIEVDIIKRKRLFSSSKVSELSR